MSCERLINSVAEHGEGERNGAEKKTLVLMDTAQITG